jgi:hypothetical protein
LGHATGPSWANPKEIVPDPNYSKNFSNGFELIQSKDSLPVFGKFQIKYVFVENEIRSNFPYWNFSKFLIEFELKIKEDLGLEIQYNLMEFD